MMGREGGGLPDIRRITKESSDFAYVPKLSYIGEGRE